jgi:hypothetical protein
MQEMRITLNNGKIHIMQIDSKFENNQANVFRWEGGNKKLDVLGINAVDKNNNIYRIFNNPNVNILPDFDLTHKASLNTLRDYLINKE